MLLLQSAMRYVTERYVTERYVNVMLLLQSGMLLLCYCCRAVCHWYVTGPERYVTITERHVTGMLLLQSGLCLFILMFQQSSRSHLVFLGVLHPLTFPGESFLLLPLDVSSRAPGDQLNAHLTGRHRWRPESTW